MSDYKRNPRGARRARKSLSRKALVVLSLMMVLVMAAVGGTLAYLIDSTAPVTNTFTIGNIDIALTETWNTDSNNDNENDCWTAKLIPNTTVKKDPKVTVEGGSEACWLFVEITENNKLSDFIFYEIADGWTDLGAAGKKVYYRAVSADAADQDFYVLKGNTVTVKDNVTKAMMDKLTDTTLPTLTFKAYAVQKDNVTSAEFAWQKVEDATFNASGANQ